MVTNDYVADFISIPNGVLPPALKPGVDISRGVSLAVADASILGAPAESVSPLSIFFLCFKEIDFRVINR